MLHDDLLEDSLEELQKKINSIEYSPEKGYRRDVSVYELVCYVNNITGCYLSNNFAPIPLFIGRARHYMTDNQVKENEKYYQLVSAYLTVMERHMSSHCCPVKE
jgi:hypothetical protein